MKYRILRMFGIILAAAVILASTATTASAAAACNVVYTISPQNTTAFGATLVIDNTGTTNWTSWTLTWSFANGQTVSSLWNGIETQSGANVTVASESYNGAVAAGGNVSGVGFNGTWNGSANAVPTNFAVNGTACNGVVSTGSFKLASSPASLSIAQGASGTDTITVTDTAPFAGSVTLAASGLPAGVTAAFGTNPAAASSVLTLTASSTATAGTSTVTITGTSGSLSATASIALTVTAASVGSFKLTPSASTLSIAQGASGADTITVTDTAPFAGSVTLAASGLPAGVTAAFATNPATSTSVLTLTASSTAAAATSTITITGTSGSLSASTTVALTVTAVSCTPTAIVPYIQVGTAAWQQTNAVTVTSTTTVVNLGPQPIAGTWSWTGPNGYTSAARQINAVPLGAGANVYVATYTNASNCKSTATFTITAPSSTGSFKLTPSAASLSIAQGASGTDTITVTDTAPFAGSVTLAASGLPAGVTAAFATNPATTTSVLTLTVASTAAAATTTITITGTSGTLSASTTIALTVTAVSTGSFKLAASAPSLSIAQGASGTDTITVTDTAPFAGSVTLAASGLPTGVTAAFATNPATSSSVLTLTAASTAAAATTTITITGTSGSLSASTTIALTVTAVGTGSFKLAPSAATLSIVQGSSGTDTITVTDTAPFAGSVTLAATGLPTGVTVAIGTNPATTTSVLTFTVAATAAAATTTITITGTSGTLSASTTIALTVTTPVTGGYAATAKANFLAMYGDMSAANGYFSPLGIPYHSVETLIVEAPDYGHETVSETYSYYIWLTAMYGAIDGNWSPLTTAWNSFVTYMIPNSANQPQSTYNPSDSATYCPTYDTPSSYPCTLNSSVSVGTDPLADELHSTYGNWDMFSAHWILDTTNWYGYGIQESGPGASGAPSFYNSYQRGPMESVWLTIPQPAWDDLKYGSPTGGYLTLFVAGTATQQWKYTDAPDADARSIQALYWAQQWSGDNSTVAALLPQGAKLGDYLRYSFFDKYFKEQGCQSTSCPTENGTKNSSAYLLSWYYAWGGALPAVGTWDWRIGSSDVHFGYQNPLAAYALSTDTALIPTSPTAKTDWTTTLQRTLQFYRWLQSAEGAIAGGATNSWGGGSNLNNPPNAWGGQYAVPPAGTPTFYGMSYIFAPSYENPPSNQWFGMQAWSMERLAEYYYVTGDPNAAVILNPWVKWVESVSTATATSWSIPSTIGWSGQPGTNWNASTQDWTVGDLGVTYNTGLHVSIVNSGEDVGVTGSLCKALLYYSAGTLKHATAQDMPSFTLAQNLLKAMWAVGRDSIGVSTPETRTDYSNFGETVYVPSGWSGTMPNGDTIAPGATFLSIRTQYETDPNYAKVAAYVAGTGPAPVINYHRFWAQTDVATAYGVYYLLFPNE